MRPSKESIEILDSRLQRLEKQNRRMGKGLAAALVMGGLFLLAGAAGSGKTLEGERFLLKDAAGKIRLSVGPGPEGLACVAYDAAGKPGTRVLINDQGQFLLKFPEPPAKPVTTPPAAPGPGAPKEKK